MHICRTAYSCYYYGLIHSDSRVEKKKWFKLHTSFRPTIQPRQQQQYPQRMQGYCSPNNPYDQPFPQHKQQPMAMPFLQWQYLYWPQPVNIAFQRPIQQPNYQQRPQQFVFQLFSQNLFISSMLYLLQQAIALATAPKPMRPYNNQLVSYNSQAIQGTFAIKQETGKLAMSRNNFQNRP